MKKLIFRNIFKDITTFFIITSLSLTLIVWVIQAVNYLDFVSEDGHSFRVYFMYSLLSLPKIFSKLILFVFFISVFFTISKYEENNEILIFWNYGIKKSEFINKIIKFSFIYFLISIIFSFLIVPKTQDMARSYIRDSSIEYFPSLIKKQHFNDTVSNLTIFVEDKTTDGLIKNIFIKENFDNNRSQIISAKEGLLAKKNGSFYLILFHGKIINIDIKNTNIIQFEKTEFNLSKFNTKSTVFPKIQETNSIKLIECLSSFINNKEGFVERLFTCDESSVNAVLQEMYKRLVVPLYIIVVGFVASCLVIKTKNQFDSIKFKSIIFILGFVFVIFSEGSINILSFDNLNKSTILLIPFIACIIGYLIFISFRKIKFL
ncbi:MAG: LptF/LptG family permease [Pelagibacterales bacterium]|nr:LptF/LptG family permease [Pelagibacterales bacterium]